MYIDSTLLLQFIFLTKWNCKICISQLYYNYDNINYTYIHGKVLRLNRIMKKVIIVAQIFSDSDDLSTQNYIKS